MALLGSSLTKALVVHTRINGSAVNFLPCDPTVSNCENLKDNLVGCDPEACKATNCPDGSIAPILPGNCCPDTSLCPATNCAAIGCLVELCPNGQMPPVPPGRCCPSALLCPREDCPASCPQAKDISNSKINQVRHRQSVQTEGLLPFLLESAVRILSFATRSENVPARKNSANLSSAPTESLPQCRRANVAPPKTSVHCNTARAYLALQRDARPETLPQSHETPAVQAKLSATTKTAPRFGVSLNAALTDQ